MAIRIFCTTFFTALATWTAAPALAFDLAAASPPAQADAAQHQPAEIISLETSVFATPAASAVTAAGDSPLAQFAHDGPTELTGRSYSQGHPAAEPGSLPLLGAAAIALLVAQLRRSRHPMP